MEIKDAKRKKTPVGGSRAMGTAAVTAASKVKTFVLLFPLVQSFLLVLAHTSRFPTVMFTASNNFAAAAAATLIATAATVGASPIVKRELQEYDRNVQVHESCNDTQREQLSQAMDEVFNITTFARDCECHAFLPFLRDSD